MYEATFNGKQVALKIFLETDAMRDRSLEGIEANSSKIVEKMEKVRAFTYISIYHI